MDKLNFQHTKAVNLARRFSEQNENDLLMEDYMRPTEMLLHSEPSKKLDHVMCQQLSTHLVHLNGLPKECLKFPDVVSDLKRRDSDTTHPTQWMS
ncbi:unnamed protein product [Cylindrotheca closterium]|uniref:Uncharacterized protein n=1 Tax=Cylindrotheca closterium TaxID=2856 RepID=A0AAD2FE09_9STRA|nr:unnamed protein product [Cylindrotheca closterium]